MRKLGAIEIKGGKGSHRKFQLPNGQRMPSPGGRKDIKPGVQRSIIRKAGITVSHWISLVLVGLVIGVPVLIVIFSEAGPFRALLNLPNEGVLAGSQYSGILTALIALVPLTLVGYFINKFTGFTSKIGMGNKRRKRRRKSK